MAKGMKTGGRDFVKGNPGSPGRPPMPSDVKEARKLTRGELEKRLSEMLQMTPEQLKEVKSNPKTTMLELIVLSILTHAVNKGDNVRLNWLTEQVLGKMKENVHVEGALKVIVEDYTRS